MSLVSSAFYNKQQKYLNIWWQGSIFLLVLLAFNIFLYLIDHRLLADEVLWIKPIKFEISLIIHFITLAVLASLLSPNRRNSLSWKGMSYLVVAAGLFEVLYIFLQAARGRESHFNNSTVIESVMYGLMGLGAVILVVGSFYLGCLLYREHQTKRNSILLLFSALGLIIGSVLTLIIASYLSSGTTGYSIDENTKNVIRMPIFSWYLDGKDLRIPHFFATHMMQIFPIYGLWLTRKNVSITDGTTRLVWSVGIYTVLVLFLFAMAIF